LNEFKCCALSFDIFILLIMNIGWIFYLTIFAWFNYQIVDAGFNTFRDMITKHIHSDHVKHSITHRIYTVDKKKKIKGYIVQLSSPLIRIEKEEHGLPMVHSFLTQLWGITNDFTLRRKFSSSIFLGCSVHLEDHSLLDKIKALPAVVRVWPIKMVSPPRIQTRIPLDEEQDLGKDSSQHKYAVHEATGVKKLHEQGIKGNRDVLVCAVDTGVDYTLKALGGGFGVGHKVVVGEDLVGPAFNGDNEPVRGGTPVNDALGHGTHVAGIIIGVSENFIGVAPEVSFGMWKVFGATGGSPDDVMLEGLVAAKEAGYNIITFSIGEPSGWSEDVLSVAASNLVDHGIFLSIANGNEGDLGLFTTDSPAGGIDVMAVGSVDSPSLWSFPAKVKPENSDGSSSLYYYSDTRLSIDEPLEIYATSYDTTITDDACNELPSNTPDLSKKIVLIRRGGCFPIDKVNNVLKKGAKYILIYNNEKHITYLGSGPGLEVAMITASDGQRIVEQMNMGKEKIFFSQIKNSPLHYQKDPIAGLLDYWSSRGPLFELRMKPEILAPGGHILSTFPHKLGGSAILSGTSMATPYLAGVAALFQSVHGISAVSPLQLKDILVTTANQVNFYDGDSSSASDLLASVAEQGGGLVQAYNAIKWSSRVHPSVLHLNDSIHYDGSHKLKIENHARKEVTYSFSDKGAGAIYTLAKDSIYPQNYPLQVEKSYATVEFAVDSLTISPGNSATVSVDITLPHSFNVSRIPLYSGYVTISSTLGEEFTIPYLGTTTNMKNVQILEQSDSYPYLTADLSDTGNKMLKNAVFKIGTVAPSVVFSLAMGSPLVSLQVFKTSDITDTILKNGDLSNKLGQNLPDFPHNYFPRYQEDPPTAVVETWNGTLATGETIKEGSYRIHLSALKIFGNAKNAKDWEKWWSEPFQMEK